MKTCSLFSRSVLPPAPPYENTIPHKTVEKEHQQLTQFAFSCFFCFITAAMCMENTPPAAKWPLMAGTSEVFRPRLPLCRALSIISSNCPSLNLQCRHTGKFGALRERQGHRQRDLPQRSPHLDAFVFRRHLALLWRNAWISLLSPVEQKAIHKDSVLCDKWAGQTVTGGSRRRAS